MNKISKQARVPARASLESFKASVNPAAIKTQLQAITGGALDGCHPVKPTIM